MHGKFEAVLAPDGTLQFTKPIKVTSPRNVIVTVLPEGMDAELYEEVMKDSPETRAETDRAMEDIRAGRYTDTAGAVEQFKAKLREAGRL
jgi:hypothetical protein